MTTGLDPSSLRLASAPVTWGVWERTTDRDDLIPAESLLATVRSLGYTGIELGPPGYIDAALLEKHGLELVGGFAPLHIADEDAYREDVAIWLDPIVEMLAATGARGPVVLADAETGERLAAAGRPEEQERTALSPDAFARALERVNRAAERVRARGVGVVFHHHTAAYVETPAEIAALLEGTDIGICFDTGHALVGGGDPIEVARLCGPRIEHLHLKDVDGDLLDRVRRGETDLEQAWGDGIFCPFGEGAVDLAAVLALPELAAFDGWTVLEQDRVAVRVTDLSAVRAVEEQNLAYLRATPAAS
jgi:inosose dehydratase